MDEFSEKFQTAFDPRALGDPGRGGRRLNEVNGVGGEEGPQDGATSIQRY